MERTLVKNLPIMVDTQVKIKGWVDVIRNQKNMQFVIVHDESGSVQVTHFRKNEMNLSNMISNLTTSSVVEIIGKVVENKIVKIGGIEIVLEQLNILSKAEPQIPITSDTALDSRLDWRYIDLRELKKRLIFEIQTTAEHAMRTYWLQHNFIEIHSPKFMGSPSESGAELFTVEYFGRKAYLAQSPQFYKQMAIAAGFNYVFEIGPVFRANPSFTSRHDTEFTSVDMEISWIDSHEDVMEFEERWLQYVLHEIKSKYGDQIKEFFNVDVIVPEVPFPRMSMTEAHALLNKVGHQLSVEGKGDLDPEGERIVARHIREKYGHEFVFVIDYPISVRPFYHMRYNDNPQITKSFDLLWKGLEITTGAQREHRYDVLAEQALEKGLTLEGIQYYLDFFKYGCPPHGGLGFGLTRMLMILLDIKNVREVTYLYRGPNRLNP